MDSIEACGPVISQASMVLQELMEDHSELYLDQFEGELDGVKDVVEMLYGGEVDLTEANIKTVFKFSVLYKVEEMLALCNEWLERNMSADNLLDFIQFGIMVERIGHGEVAVLDICYEFIKNGIKDKLLDISTGWNIPSSDVSFTMFLINKEILYYTLPLLKTRVNTDSDVFIVLCELEDKGVVDKLWEFEDRSVDLLEVMCQKVQSLETYKMLTRVQTVYSKSLVSNCRIASKYSSKNMVCGLLSGDYRLFSAERMLGLENEFSISHFQFVDIVLEWVAANKPSQINITELWGKVRHEELCLDYLYCARNVIIQSLGKVSLPPIDEGLEFKFMLAETVLVKSDYLDQIEFRDFCNNCDKDYSFAICLADSIPCWGMLQDIGEDSGFTHCDVEHVFLNYENDIRGYGYFSCLTNSYSSVIEKIKECWDSNTKVYLGCICQCADKLFL